MWCIIISIWYAKKIERRRVQDTERSCARLWGSSPYFSFVFIHVTSELLDDSSSKRYSIFWSTTTALKMNVRVLFEYFTKFVDVEHYLIILLFSSVEASAGSCSICVNSVCTCDRPRLLNRPQICKYKLLVMIGQR